MRLRTTSMRAALPLFNLAISSSTFLVLFFEIQAPFQPVVVLTFTFICLGTSVIQFIDFGDLATNLTFVIAVGLTTMAIAAGAMIYLTGWQPYTAVIGLSIICGTLAFSRLLLR